MAPWQINVIDAKIRSATIARAIATNNVYPRDVLCDIKYKYFVCLSIGHKKYAALCKTVFAR